MHKPQICSRERAAEPSQLRNHWHPSAGGIQAQAGPVSKSAIVIHRKTPGPRPSQAWREAVPAWQHHGNAEHCLDYGCVSRGETSGYTPSKHPPSCQAAVGCFEAFLENPQSLQPTLGWHSPASPCAAPITDTQTLTPGDVRRQQQQQQGAAAPARAHGGP